MARLSERCKVVLMLVWLKMQFIAEGNRANGYSTNNRFHYMEHRFACRYLLGCILPVFALYSISPGACVVKSGTQRPLHILILLPVFYRSETVVCRLWLYYL